MKNIIIAAGISEESETFAFRAVTFFSQKTLEVAVLILSDKELIDLYWKYLQQRGLLDYINYILSLDEKEEGIKIDNNKKADINIRGIRLDNQFDIEKRIEKFQKSY